MHTWQELVQRARRRSLVALVARHMNHTNRIRSGFNVVEFTAKDVLPRPRIHVKYSLTDDEIEQFLRLLQEHAIHVIPPGEWRFCRDPDDDLILETAILGEARYAVSAGTSAAL